MKASDVSSWLGVLAALAALLALSCTRERAEPAVTARPVVLVPVTVAELEEHIEVSGQLIARNHAAIASEVSGRITEIVFDEGQEVAAGDVILEIDPERRQLELASARARLQEAQAGLREDQREYERRRKLKEREIASVAQLDQAATELELGRARRAAAEAEVGVAERALQDASVKAPFPGRIARRFVSRGEYVTTGKALVELVALEPIEVEFFVAERDSARVELGQQVMVRVDPFPDETFAATVTVISPTIDSRTRTLRVLAQMEEGLGRLRPGLFARADLGVATRSGAILVPEEAVLQRADGAVVFRLAPGSRVERVAVQTGAHRHGLVEVAKGLGPRDVVVTRGHASLVDGMVVSPRNPDGTVMSSEIARSEVAPGQLE